MNKIIVMIFLLACALPAHAGRLNVLTTTTDLRSVTEYIGGDKVKAESLGRGTQNYHFLAAKPSYMIKAKRADLFIVNGLDLEIGYLQPILEGSRNPDIQLGRRGYLDASEGIHPLDIPHKLDRSMGDIHAGGNPHYWTDPVNMKIVAGTIAHRLAELDTVNASYYRDRLLQFSNEVDNRLKEWQERLRPFRGQKLITYHQSWSYFADRFGLKVIDELEPKPGVPPGPGHLNSIIQKVKEEGVKVILHENLYKDDAARFIERNTGVEVVIVPLSVGGVEKAVDYFSLVDIIVNRLEKGFRS